MQPHQERVVTEREELNEKRIKLISFIETAAFNSLNGAEKDRLRKQAAIMTDYFEVLGERINSFAGTEPCEMDPRPRNCNENCPGNIDHKTPVNIISRVNYRLAHNALSLAADEEWLMRDAVSCVMELVAEIEALKAQGQNAIHDLIKTIQVREETISFLREESRSTALECYEMVSGTIDETKAMIAQKFKLVI